jgi:hypothetical protein
MLWMPLLMIVGCVVFLTGFFTGTRVVAAVLVRRERQLAYERRVINEVWRRLRSRFGVDRDAYVSDFIERPKFRRDP